MSGPTAPRIAVFSGPTATIHNSQPLVTSNKARAKYGLPLRPNPDGSPTRFDAVIAPYKPDEQDLNNVLQDASTADWLGTDALGRDSLSRIIFGFSARPLPTAMWKRSDWTLRPDKSEPMSVTSVVPSSTRAPRTADGVLSVRVSCWSVCGRKTRRSTSARLRGLRHTGRRSAQALESVTDVPFH
jgi:hypothetical protein